MRSHLVLTMFCGLSLGATSVNAKTTSVNSLTRVTFDSDADSLSFTFHARHAIDGNAISASSEGDVLNLRLEQTRVKRRWVQLTDPSVVRALLHPSKRDEPAAVLRIRMPEAVPESVLRNVIVRVEGKLLVAVVPRDATVAARWANPTPVADAAADGTTETAQPTAAEPGAAATTGTEAVAGAAGNPVVLDETTIAIPAREAEGADEAVAADESATAEATPIATEENTPIATAETTDEAAIAEMGLAPATSGPSLGALAMSMLFLMAIGFVMWRKMRPATATKAGGRAIRPVGSHMLGPKHHLLLVDVAGQLVLLGSGDKGVQMLTTIPRNDSVTPADVEVPADAMPEATATPQTFADRLGTAVARIRDAARGMKKPSLTDELTSEEVEREFFAREEEAVREAAESDALALLADDVDDKPEVGRARMRRAVQKPKPAPKATPKVDERASLENDLLRKIRRLQSA